MQVSIKMQNLVPLNSFFLNYESVSSGARHFVESHFVGTTFGRIRLLVDVTFRRVQHSVEKNARYDIPSKWSTQLFFNKTLMKSIYLVNGAVINQHSYINTSVTHY